MRHSLASSAPGRALCFALAFAALMPACGVAHGAREVGDWLDGRWNASGDKFTCSLERDVPGYGIARFSHEAGSHLEFTVDLRHPLRADVARLSLRTPPWHPRRMDDEALGAVSLNASAPNVRLGEKLSDRLLWGLRDGWVAAISPDRDPARTVSVAGVGLRSALDAFSQCRGALAPVNLRQVERTAVYFPHDEYGLTSEGIKALDRVITYLSYDDSIQSLLIDGHTDSTGTEKHNAKLSKRRAETLRKYLQQHGVDAAKLVVRYHADDEPAARNTSDGGRALNRRATVRLSKEPPPAPEASKTRNDAGSDNSSAPAAANATESSTTPPAPP